MSAGRRRVWALAELRAEWRSGPGYRYQTGFSFVCPVHRSHRLRVRLANPADGELEESWGMSVVAHRDGKTIGDLTLTTPAGDEDLDFGHCGRMRIIDGRVYRVRPLARRA